jgi:hypothetical protein
MNPLTFTVSYDVARQATEKCIRLFHCTNCDAKAGERCRSYPSGLRIDEIHIGRMPANVDPAVFLEMSDEEALKLQP